jgi:U3 small nucleolar RNA-associated protein 22
MKGNSRVSGLGFCLDEDRWRVCERDVHLLLSQGLTDRSKLVRAIWKNFPSDWNIHDVRLLIYFLFQYYQAYTKVQFLSV